VISVDPTTHWRHSHFKNKQTKAGVKGDPSSSPTEHTALFKKLNTKTEHKKTRSQHERRTHIYRDNGPFGKQNKTKDERETETKWKKIKQNKTKDERENRNRSRREKRPPPPVQFPQ